MIKAQHPKYLNELGKRRNNEDAFYYIDNLFIVCDGVGGANKGEVASHLASQKMAEFIENTPNNIVNEDFCEKAIRFIEAAFDEQIKAKPECSGMGTTLVALYLTDKAYVIWAGDSPLYQFRDGKIIYKTKDHSLVQKMVDKGEITEEQALTHPQKNIILRAINGSTNPTNFEFTVLDDVQADDLFLLCTDGVNDGLSNEKIEQIVALADGDTNFIVEQLNAYCAKYSSDNYTCIVTKIDKLEQTASTTKTGSETSVLMKYGGYVLVGLLFILLSVMGYKFGQNRAKMAKVDKAFKAAQAFYQDSLYQSANEELAAIDSTYLTEDMKALQANIQLRINELAFIASKEKRLDDELETANKLAEMKMAKDSTLTITDFEPLKRYIQGRHHYLLKRFDQAFLFLNGIEKIELVDTMLYQTDWRMLKSLYTTESKKDTTQDFSANIFYCDQRLKETTLQ